MKLLSLSILCAFVLTAAPALAAPRSAWPWRAHAAAAAPAPDDTIEVTATTPYLGVAGHGRAYVALAPGHTQITNPILVLEGFDIDNAMGWDELYELLNQQNLVEDLRGRGYDLVVLDFADATDYIQRNTFVFTELLAQVEAQIAPEQTIAVIGPSMGGLVGRYGLAWLESQAIPHRVRTFLSYDGVHRGANIPLGLQYWVDFFSGQSADAAYFRDRLNTPAARQMLAYHFTNPPSASPSADPLKATLDADIAAVGSYPSLPRLVAFANGSGIGQDQGYAAGAQLIQYSYSNFLVTILGNVWAVPNGGPATVFNGRIRIILVQDTQRTVTVSGTLPYDNAPGGWRASMAQLDTTQAPYGDIVALHNTHCFVPTVSALDVPGADLFATGFGGSPFDAVYSAEANEEHVHISSIEAEELLAELDPPVGVAGSPGPRLAILAAAPNPSAGALRLSFLAPSAGPCEARVYAASGRLVRGMSADGAAGARTLTWDGRDDRGATAPAGIYFVRIAQGPSIATARVVRLP